MPLRNGGKQTMKETGLKRRILFILFGCLLLCAVTGASLLLRFDRRVHHFHSDETRRTDMTALAESDCDGLLLSMYSPEAFDGEDFRHYRDISVAQAFHACENLADIGDYLAQGFSHSDSLRVVYMGLDPYAVSRLYRHHASLYIRDYEKYLISYAQAHPDTGFEILLPARSLETLRELPEGEYEELVGSYRNFVNICASCENVKVYFIGHEKWLTANPENYEDACCKPAVLHTLLAFTFRDDAYVLTADNAEERLGQMTELVQAEPMSYPDLSRWCMVFFGDSVLVNCGGSFSIPGVVEGLTGAQTYNLGVSGVAAADTVGAELSLNRAVDRFLEQDAEGLKADRICFVIEFGLNDYFGGIPADSSDNGWDVTTYGGALRTGIRTLRESYPDAEILVLTPTYTAKFSGGTEKLSGEGGVLTDYVETAVRVADEMGVRCINNYADSGINADSYELYLSDQTHPNEAGAYLLGERIAKSVAKWNISEE